MGRFLLTLLGLFTSAVGTTIDAYIATESPIAKAGVLANIGPSGSLSSGAYVGALSGTSPDAD